MTNERNTILFENCRIGFRNFKGAEGRYNREGDRNFIVFLDDPALADQLLNDGWNVKTLKARDEDEADQPYLPVSMGYSPKSRPPRVVMITSRGRTDLGVNEVEILDYADIRNVDLIINPYNWVVNGEVGIKAYVKSLFVTIEEDALELKYSDVPDANSSAHTDPPWEE